MHLNKRGICKDITLQGQSSFGYLDLKFSSTCRNISVWDRSMLSGMQALTHCMIGNINIAGEAVVNSCRISDHCIADDIECSGQRQLRDLHIRDSMCGEINYTENQGPADLHILGGVFNGISLTDATMAAISVQDSCFYFHSENSSVGTLELNECQILNLIWKMGSKGEVFINGSTLLHLDLTNMTLTKETLFSLSDCQVQYCIMDNLFVQGQLLLKRLFPLQERFEWQSHVSNRIIHFSHDPIITGRINAVTEKIRRNFSSTLLDIFAAFNPGVADHFYSLRDHLFQKYGRDFEREPETMELQTEGHWFTFNSTGNRETDIDALKQLVTDKYYTTVSIFRLCYTSLGKTEIIDSNLNGFRFEFLNSKLLDCFISGTQLSKNNIKIHIYDPNSVQPLDEEVVFEQRVSFYSQLKKVFDNQGNVVETGWYHARAMESQQKLLNLLLRKQPGSWVKDYVAIAFGMWSLSG